MKNSSGIWELSLHEIMEVGGGQESEIKDEERLRREHGLVAIVSGVVACCVMITGVIVVIAYLSDRFGLFDYRYNY